MIPEQDPTEQMLHEAATLLVLTTMRAHAAEALAKLHADNARRWKRAALLNAGLLVAVAIVNILAGVLS